MPKLRPLALLTACLLLLAPASLPSQERGAVALAELLDGIGVTTRVLVIAAHPDDEDTRLIAWAARGRHAETAYLSLTRGDGGQNLIGNELGEALGVIRSEELLTARRIDGGRQYFTRAYDFGYSKTADETFAHWPRAELLRDVVTVVRAFRPHVIVSIFSGTPRDRHGHHQVAGILAREAYDIAGDSASLPASATAGHGPWTPLKFYRSSNFSPGDATLSFNVGEYSHLLGRSYAEIAGDSRSQHKSQGFGVLQRRGVVLGHVRMEHARVPTEAGTERSIFAGLDTTHAVLRTLLTGRQMLPPLVALDQAIAAARDSVNPLRPASAIGPLHQVREAVAALQRAASSPGAARDAASLAEARQVIAGIDARASRAMLAALGAAVEPMAPRPVLAVDDTATLQVAVYNRGPEPFRVDSIVVDGGSIASVWATAVGELLPDSARTARLTARGARVSQPWWLEVPRRGAMFVPAIDGRAEAARAIASATVHITFRGQQYVLDEPVVHRFADPVRGDVQRTLAVVPAVSVTLDNGIEYAPAGEDLVRTVRVRLQSGVSAERQVRVRIEAPAGLRPDSASRTITLAGHETHTIAFTLRGRAAARRDSVRVIAESAGRSYASGYTPIEYEHIRERQLHAPSTLALQGVALQRSNGLRVAYIRGVGDNSMAALEQLGVEVSALEPADIPSTDLSRFTTVVVGPRAYAASDDLVRHNALLLDFVRRGGTMVVQYGQYEMMRPGIMPYPVTIRRPHDRVTDENAPIQVLEPRHRLLVSPNAISAADFEGWVQERGLYMPHEFDAAYTPLLATNDPGEDPNRGALLVARYGQGTYVYTTLAFFRQLPAGVPGAARLFVNLLARDARDTARTAQ